MSAESIQPDQASTLLTKITAVIYGVSMLVNLLTRRFGISYSEYYFILFYPISFRLARVMLTIVHLTFGGSLVYSLLYDRWTSHAYTLVIVTTIIATLWVAYNWLIPNSKKPPGVNVGYPQEVEDFLKGVEMVQHGSVLLSAILLYYLWKELYVNWSGSLGSKELVMCNAVAFYFGWVLASAFNLIPHMYRQKTLPAIWFAYLLEIVKMAIPVVLVYNQFGSAAFMPFAGFIVATGVMLFAVRKPKFKFE